MAGYGITLEEVAWHDLAVLKDRDRDRATAVREGKEVGSGRIFRLAGRGLPRVGRTRRGDLHMEIELEVPAHLDDAQRQVLAQWAQTLSADTHPSRAAFDKSVQERK